MGLKETLSNALSSANQLAALVEKSQFGDSNYENRDITRRWGVKDAADLVGVTRQAIDKAEREGRLPAPDRRENNSKLGYTIYQINDMRTFFNTFPHRKPGDPTLVASVCGHKGGGKKTALTVHCCQWLVLQGYRVLIVDHDPQGTTSLYHGYSPLSVKDSKTLLPWYMGDQQDLTYAINNTYWPGLDIIPSNLSVDRIKVELAKMAEADELQFEPHLMLHAGLETIKDNYDFIFIDGTPDLSDITVNMVFAADLILCPTPAVFADYISTSQFFNMMLAMVDDIDDEGFSPDLKVIVTNYDGRINSQSHIMNEYIRSTWGNMVLLNNFKQTEEVPKAQLKMRTVFEQATSERSNHGAYKTAMAIFEPLFEEILNSLLLPKWPSKQEGDV